MTVMESVTTGHSDTGLMQSWRWYGPGDPVSLTDIRQAGAQGVVTALHETYDGEAWTSKAIAERNHQVEQSGLTWSVVESIPIHPSIKLGSNQADHFTDAFATSMERLAEQGIKTICYNFMPVVDWTRTDLRYPLSHSGLTLRFDAVEFAAYDCFILERDGALSDYTPEIVSQARICAKGLTPQAVSTLEHTIIAGLPGSELSHTRESIRTKIAAFDGIDDATMLNNLIRFLQVVIPRAEACGAKLCIHPDDPPFSLFGLPRVVSTADDYHSLLSAVPSPSNGMTLCAGSLASRADNDVPSIVEQFADRIHFVHLRNVKREAQFGIHGSFYESDHLGGDVDMVEVLKRLMSEQRRRKSEGRSDWRIPMRPDHGPLLLDDLHKSTNPGYSAIGRLKGLAELRGVMTTLEHQHHD